MPIKAENMALYPGGSIHSPEWQAIRSFIRARAGDCCEECGVRNHALGGRLRDGTFLKAKPTGDNGLRITWPSPGDWDWCGDINSGVKLRIIKIVCTVAHLDGKLVDHSESNLAFLCQRCHNRLDARWRQENAAITRAEKAGQLDLIGRRQ